jgi:4-amino-4-deoxy-L-arabinose transferase-like glycosyltransferase
LAAGVLTGVGALTRYAFGWTIIPVALFLFFFSGQRRVLHALAALGAFVMVLTPWVIRNYAVSGTPFGTAGFAFAEGVGLFPRFQLERSVHPDLTHILWFKLYVQNFGECARHFGERAAEAGRQLGEHAVSGGFAVGFSRNGRAANALFFAHVSGLFIVVQALGRTQLSDESPEVNSENLLVLLIAAGIHAMA